MKSWIIFSIIVSLAIVLIFTTNLLFINDYLYYQTFGGQITHYRIDQILELSRKYQWLGYFIIPVVILLRVFYTSTTLFIGIFFTELKAEFSKLFKIALLADFVYVLSAFTKLVILIFFKEVNTLDDLQFQPFSVMELLGKNSVDPLFAYPLSLLNIFELAYFLVLAGLLIGVVNEANKERQVNFSQSLRLVTASYGSGLLLWVVFVMFITLNLS